MDFYYANLIKKYSRKMPIENDVVDKKNEKNAIGWFKNRIRTS